MCWFEYVLNFMQELGKDIMDEKKDEKKELVDKVKNLFERNLFEDNDNDNTTIPPDYESVDASSNRSYSLYEYDNDEYFEPGQHLEKNTFESCKCMPACSSIHYDSAVSQTNFNIIKYYKANKAYEKRDEQ